MAGAALVSGAWNGALRNTDAETEEASVGVSSASKGAAWSNAGDAISKNRQIVSRLGVRKRLVGILRLTVQMVLSIVRAVYE